MAKERKEGFIYILSDALKQEVAFSKKTGWLYCEDGVKYSPQELDVIFKAGAIVDLTTHNVKKIIGGEVVKIEQAGDQVKPDEGSGGNNKNTNSNAADKIPESHGNSTQNRDGELEIY